MNIIFIGPRSVGKSTIGKVLAKKLRYKYIEFDKIVEGKLKGIDKYCKKYGIDSYRKKEQDILKKVVKNLPKNFVMCIGGGTIASQLKKISKENIKILKRYGKLVYLNPSKNNKEAIEILRKREKLRRGNQSFEHTSNLYKIRKPIYEKAKDYEIIVKNKTPRQIVNEILINV